MNNKTENYFLVVISILFVFLVIYFFFLEKNQSYQINQLNEQDRCLYKYSYSSLGRIEAKCLKYFEK